MSSDSPLVPTDPRHDARQARTGRLDAAKALLARGVDVNAKLEGGQTAIMWAAAEGHLAVVEALIAAVARD